MTRGEHLVLLGLDWCHVGGAAAAPRHGAESVESTARSGAGAVSQCGGPRNQASDPRHVTEVGRTVFFTADDGIHGRELWKSNGTEEGTALVKDVQTGIRHGSPSSMTDVAGTLFFTADDGIRGSELWRSDGTEAGTVLVKDINAGGRFTVATSGTANTRTGTMNVRVRVAAAGTLRVSPVGDSRVRGSVQDVASAGTTTVTLRPTRAGMRILKRVGTLKVKARFTFTPCGGTGSSVVRQYTLRLR